MSQRTALELGDADAGGTFAVRVGGEVVIRLAENPTTGYAWELTQSGPGALRVAENRFVSGPSGASPLVGAAGERVIRLVAERGGVARLELVERRPWEDAAKALQRRGFTIEVQG